MVGTRGMGAFGEAELGRVEGGVGPLRFATHVNLNSGIGVRNDGVEVSAIGFGFTAGKNGVSASLPVFTVGLGQRSG